jgi:hypothetical protein
MNPTWQVKAKCTHGESGDDNIIGGIILLAMPEAITTY